MATFTALLGVVDEDGFQRVEISDEDTNEVLEVQWIRCDQARQWAAQEVAIRQGMQDDGECEHGMSAALCEGPMHW